MANIVTVDRKKLAEYIKQHADALAATANIDIRIVKVESMGGEAMFMQTADVELNEIPLEGLEA